MYIVTHFWHDQYHFLYQCQGRQLDFEETGTGGDDFKVGDDQVTKHIDVEEGTMNLQVGTELVNIEQVSPDTATSKRIEEGTARIFSTSSIEEGTVEQDYERTRAEKGKAPMTEEDFK